MRALLLSLVGVLSITLLATPTLGAGWPWEMANGVGFLAYAGLLYLSVSSGPGINVAAHQVLGFTVLGVATAHVFGLLLFDAAVIEYIKFGAPAYMWVGILSFVLLIALIFVGLPEYRLRLHKRYVTFKYWHRALAIAAIAGAGYHILASGFYLNSIYQIVLFVVLTAFVLLGTRRFGLVTAMTPRTSWIYIASGVLCVLLFAGIRNLPT